MSYLTSSRFFRLISVHVIGRVKYNLLPLNRVNVNGTALNISTNIVRFVIRLTFLFSGLLFHFSNKRQESDSATLLKQVLYMDVYCRFACFEQDAFNVLRKFQCFLIKSARYFISIDFQNFKIAVSKIIFGCCVHMWCCCI